MNFWGENQGTVTRKAKKERKEVGKAKMIFYDLTIFSTELQTSKYFVYHSFFNL